MPELNCNVCIDDYYTLTGEYCGEWAGATLRKVPLWGDFDGEFNFEWPTEIDFAQMKPDVKLQSLDLSIPDNTAPSCELASIQVGLSNGE